MRTAILRLAFACLLSMWMSCEEKAPEFSPSLDFLLGEESPKKYSLNQLKSELEEHELSIYDPEYKKDKKYKGFLFNDVLNLVFGPNYQQENWTGVSFSALDGYKAVVDLNNFYEPDAYLVFADLEHENWEVIPNHGEDTVAPFYLVWTKAEKIPKNGFSWPWQIASVSLIRVQDKYTSITPDEEKVSPAVYAGYKLFMLRCTSCHALGGVGGFIGPDLNKPKNILEYRSEEIVRAFIVESSSYRISKMPDFKDLSTEQVDQLIAYLNHLKMEKSEKTEEI